MAYADIDICNLALGRIGVDRTIASLNEKSKEARLCKRFYALARASALLAAAHASYSEGGSAANVRVYIGELEAIDRSGIADEADASLDAGIASVKAALASWESSGALTSAHWDGVQILAVRLRAKADAYRAGVDVQTYGGSGVMAVDQQLDADERATIAQAEASYTDAIEVEGTSAIWAELRESIASVALDNPVAGWFADKGTPAKVGLGLAVAGVALLGLVLLFRRR